MKKFFRIMGCANAIFAGWEFAEGDWVFAAFFTVCSFIFFYLSFPRKSTP